jgi:hypothetical protein
MTPTVIKHKKRTDTDEMRWIVEGLDALLATAHFNDEDYAKVQSIRDDWRDTLNDLIPPQEPDVLSLNALQERADREQARMEAEYDRKLEDMR